ncbi:MAG: hypothetical protein Q8S18_10865 [Bacteroidales bacterium]|nr:hypothetical protein [Bacteroidales bacterium]
MKFLYFSILYFSFYSISFSQDAHINCTIFVDGKLPEGSAIYDSYFTYFDNMSNEIRIDFNYVIGEIQLNEKNSNSLHVLDPNDSICMNFSYRKYNGRTYTYSGKLKIIWLSYRYLIIRITNLNRKKGIYYFGYSTPDVSKKFISKEYDMFEEY